jgi:hypothetical protein
MKNEIIAEKERVKEYIKQLDETVAPVIYFKMHWCKVVFNIYDLLGTE